MIGCMVLNVICAYVLFKTGIIKMSASPEKVGKTWRRTPKPHPAIEVIQVSLDFKVEQSFWSSAKSYAVPFPRS